MANIGVVDNIRTMTLTDGATVTLPKVALATSWATLTISGANPGDTYNVTSGDGFVKLSINADGEARMSLAPFIELYLSGSDGDMTETDSTQRLARNYFRGFLIVVILHDTSRDQLTVPFVYGGANPLASPNRRYFDYIANGQGTWLTMDLASNYDDDGNVLSSAEQSWLNANYNANIYSPNDNDKFRWTMTLATFEGGRIRFKRQIINFTRDCRQKDVMQVKWIDGEGQINTRLLTYAGIVEGSETQSSYTRHHWERNASLVGNGYWHGADAWEKRKATKQITLGDDNIPMEKYSWLASLVQSPSIDVWADMGDDNYTWQRANIVDSTIEADPRKTTFSLTVTLALDPTFPTQQF